MTPPFVPTQTDRVHLRTITDLSSVLQESFHEVFSPIFTHIHLSISLSSSLSLSNFLSLTHSLTHSLDLSFSISSLSLSSSLSTSVPFSWTESMKEHKTVTEKTVTGTGSRSQRGCSGPSEVKGESCTLRQEYPSPLLRLLRLFKKSRKY